MILGPIAVLAVWLARFRWPGWLVFLVASVLMLGSGGRGTFIFACAAVGFLFLIERRRNWFDWRLMLLAATSLIAFNAVVSDRGASVRGMLGGGETDVYSAKYDLDPLEHMDFAGMEYFEYIVYAVPQRTGSYDYFAHNLQILTEPIPRVLWEGKPIGSPVQFFKLWDYGTPIGMTISMPGAGWMSLGYLGIVIQAAIFALLYGWIYQRLMMRTESAFARLLFALLVATSIVVFRDGIMLTFVRQLPFYIGPLAIVWAIVWFTTPRLASQPTLPHAPGLQAGSSPRERRRALAAQVHRP
nr:O-antigen polymerase [Qipengyuania proteolytica]